MMKFTKEFLDKCFEDMRTHMDGKTQTKLVPLFTFTSGVDFDDDNLRNYVFNRDNWNSGQAFIRTFLLGLWNTGNRKATKSIPTEEDTIVITAKISCCADDWWGYIIVESENDFKPSDVYLVSWYKSHGSTDMIQKNGEDIDLDDYLKLLNLLDLAGFDITAI